MGWIFLTDNLIRNNSTSHWNEKQNHNKYMKLIKKEQQRWQLNLFKRGGLADCKKRSPNITRL